MKLDKIKFDNMFTKTLKFVEISCLFQLFPDSLLNFYPSMQSLLQSMLNVEKILFSGKTSEDLRRMYLSSPFLKAFAVTAGRKSIPILSITILASVVVFSDLGLREDFYSYMGANSRYLQPCVINNKSFRKCQKLGLTVNMKLQPGKTGVAYSLQGTILDPNFLASNAQAKIFVFDLVKGELLSFAYGVKLVPFEPYSYTTDIAEVSSITTRYDILGETFMSILPFSNLKREGFSFIPNLGQATLACLYGFSHTDSSAKVLNMESITPVTHQIFFSSGNYHTCFFQFYLTTPSGALVPRE